MPLRLRLEHDKADALLREVANLIRNHARGHCFISRIRGPIFGIIAPEYDQDQTIKLAGRLRQVVGEYHPNLPGLQPDAPQNLTISLGMVCCPDDGRDVRELYDLALARMELARRTGGNHLITQGRGTTPDRQAG